MAEAIVGMIWEKERHLATVGPRIEWSEREDFFQNGLGLSGEVFDLGGLGIGCGVDL